MDEMICIPRNSNQIPGMADQIHSHVYRCFDGPVRVIGVARAHRLPGPQKPDYDDGEVGLRLIPILGMMGVIPEVMVPGTVGVQSRFRGHYIL